MVSNFAIAEGDGFRALSVLKEGVKSLDHQVFVERLNQANK